MVGSYMSLRFRDRADVFGPENLAGSVHRACAESARWSTRCFTAHRLLWGKETICLSSWIRVPERLCVYKGPLAFWSWFAHIITNYTCTHTGEFQQIWSSQQRSGQWERDRFHFRQHIICGTRMEKRIFDCMHSEQNEIFSFQRQSKLYSWAKMNISLFREHSLSSRNTFSTASSWAKEESTAFPFEQEWNSSFSTAFSREQKWKEKRKITFDCMLLILNEKNDVENEKNIILIK